eukprot:830245-Alexandrium_andersonii.AAC.1
MSASLVGSEMCIRDRQRDERMPSGYLLGSASAKRRSPKASVAGAWRAPVRVGPLALGSALWGHCWRPRLFADSEFRR